MNASLPEPVSPEPVSMPRLLALWQETLGIPDAGLDDNFFDAGGSSLLATRLAARVKSQLGCTVSAADILGHPSVRLLTRKLNGEEDPLDRSSSQDRALKQRQAFRATRPLRVPPGA